ncbi:MAG: Rho termination factor N-terminal domain-containing protein [Leptolyngbyaceae cyanobacterium]
MSNQSYEEKYTKPDLRRQLKEEIKQSDRGGDPGQWSARKSQLLVKEYEKQGGGYKGDNRDEVDYDSENDSENGDNRSNSRTKKELYDKAKELDVDGRSSMNKSELKQAIAKEKVGDATKQELYDQAKNLEIDGRSSMNKAELKEAIVEENS